MALEILIIFLQKKQQTNAPKEISTSPKVFKQDNKLCSPPPPPKLITPKNKQMYLPTNEVNAAKSLAAKKVMLYQRPE